MTFLEKINDLSIKLIEIKEKFDSIDKTTLLKDDLEELIKLENLLNFYISTIVELVMDENIEFVKSNKEMVKKIVNNIEQFINQVNENINQEFFQ